MPNRTPVTPYVTLFDAHGLLVWTNHPNPVFKPGVPVWEHFTGNYRESLKDHISRAVFMRETQQFEVTGRIGEHLRVWVWPLNVTGLAACLIAQHVPDEIKFLTRRERDCLQLMATGKTTSDIAAELDVSVSTVHTYQRRARERLHLSSTESLIAFASRYCFPPDTPFYLRDLVPSKT
jgi:DNA-binding CsgD family transcriptional regulator